MRGSVVHLVIGVCTAAPVVFAMTKAPRRWYLASAGVVLALGLTAGAATVAMGYQITENLTTSLNGNLYVHREGEPFKKGDLVAFRWTGGATYPKGTIFIKQVVGMPGDVVRREGSRIWVNDQYIGVAKPKSRAGVPLAPAAAGAIPPGHYFVATESPDSLDSRYALTGNIGQDSIVGRAHEIF